LGEEKKKKKEERRNHGKNIMPTSASQGCHKNTEDVQRLANVSSYSSHAIASIQVDV